MCEIDPLSLPATTSVGGADKASISAALHLLAVDCTLELGHSREMQIDSIRLTGELLICYIAHNPLV